MPDAVNTAAAAEPEAPAVDEGKHWAKTLIVVGKGPIPAGNKRAVIVVEARSYDEDLKPTLMTSGYPDGADLYYRTDPEVKFPAKANILTLGQNVKQATFWGFCPQMSHLNVGPASPAYGAANRAWQEGAKEIEITGLSTREKEQLKPWFDKLAEGGPAPVEDAPDVRAPADVKIILS